MAYVIGFLLLLLVLASPEASGLLKLSVLIVLRIALWGCILLFGGVWLITALGAG